jgi:hypothetical protein
LPRGVFTETSLFHIDDLGNALMRPIRNFMSDDFTIGYADQSVANLYTDFKTSNLRCVAVLGQGKLVGTISNRDLMPLWTELIEVNGKKIMREYERAVGLIVHDLRSPISLIMSLNYLLMGDSTDFIDEFRTENFQMGRATKQIDDHTREASIIRLQEAVGAQAVTKISRSEGAIHA